MDQQFAAEMTVETANVDNPLVEMTSSEYMGRWNHLVSTTNWEKGRIICEWREALLAAGAPLNSCTDEAWSRRVSNVTPQHAGRLRRVWQQFGAVRQQYAGLYWSHFQAALDWSDAEMWLEGAVQNGWSIAQMQQQRSCTLDGLAAAEPPAADTMMDQLDEDANPDDSQPPASVSSSLSEVHDAGDAGGAEGDDDDGGADVPFEAADSFADQSPLEAVRPFEGLAPLPADLGEAFEAFKLAIVHHRHADWAEISCEQVLAVLDALRQFALLPAVL